MLKLALLICALAAPVVKADTQDAKNAFAKTLATGDRKWSFQDAKLTITRSASSARSKPAVTVNKCSSKEAPVSVKGDFPSVKFSLGSFNCDIETRELTIIKSITSIFNFEAFHIPAGTSEPNQFRLVLKNKALTYPRVDVSSIGSLNALTKDNVVYMDFIATEKDRLSGMDSVYYYADISIERGADGQPDKLRVGLIIDDNNKGTKTELDLLAALIPVK